MGGLTLTEERKEAQDYNISYNAVSIQRIFIEIHAKSAREYERSFETAAVTRAPQIYAIDYARSFETTLTLAHIIECDYLLDYIPSISLWYADVPIEITITDPEIVIYIDHDLATSIGDSVTIYG